MSEPNHTLVMLMIAFFDHERVLIDDLSKDAYARYIGVMHSADDDDCEEELEYTDLQLTAIDAILAELRVFKK